MIGRALTADRWITSHLNLLTGAERDLIDLDPGRPMLPTSLDAGPTRFRKLVDTLAH